MKKVITLAAILVSALAQAEYYLLWEFDQTGTGNQVEFTYAKIRVSGDDVSEPTYLTLENGDIAGFAAAGVGKNGATTGTKIEPNYVELGSYADSAYSFAVELFTTGSTETKMSDVVTFTDLKAFHSVYENMATTGNVPYNFAVHNIPEPTGGMLVLLGVGALALRRKKM